MVKLIMLGGFLLATAQTVLKIAGEGAGLHRH
jgi:hypothetical protein